MSLNIQKLADCKKAVSEYFRVYPENEGVIFELHLTGDPITTSAFIDWLDENHLEYVLDLFNYEVKITNPNKCTTTSTK